MVTRSPTSQRFALLSCTALSLMLLHCGSQSADSTATSETDQAMSYSIHDIYGLTTFGGPGDYQSMACGGNSGTSQPWYSASSQRYGCGVHLRVEGGGRCVVVKTEDAGPASYVESRAGIAVLDASPSVGDYLFGQRDLGYSDLRDNPSSYRVRVAVTTLPLGPCDGSSPEPPTPTPTPTPSASCAGDGDCNPGNDGSGLICVSGSCVPGCHSNAQCPGIETCVGGSCQ